LQENAVTITTSSVAAPARLNFAAASTTAEEKTLAGLLSKTFIADAAKVVRATFKADVTTDLNALKADLLAGESLMQIGPAIASDFGSLAEDGVAKPYNKAAGKALAADFTTARANALYDLLPRPPSKGAFNADISKLKTGLETGKGFAELFHIFT